MNSRFELNNKQICFALGLFSAAVAMNFHSKSEFMLWFKYTSILLLLVQAFRLSWYLPALISTCVASLYYTLFFPRLPNHSSLELFIGICIIILFGLKFIRRKSPLSPEIIPWIFRVSLISVYWFAGFHKLNTGYFDLNSSCAIRVNDLIIDGSVNYLGLARTSVIKTLIIATFVLEMIIPFGLLFRSSRKITALLLLLFHAYLSIRVFADFSALAVFLIAGSLLDFSPKTQTDHLEKSFRTYSVFVASAILIETLLNQFKYPMTVYTVVHGIIYNFGVLLLFVAIYRTKTTALPLSRNQKIGLLIIPIAVALWSIRPYLGLGNTANLTMFSNLVTEKSRSNHFFIDTKFTKLTTWEENYVECVALPEQMKNEELEGFLLPKQELSFIIRTYAARYPKNKLPAILVYQGKRLNIPDLKTSAFAEYERLYKYVFFRRIPKEGPCPCLW